MAKGQTFGEMFPPGTCCLCQTPCDLKAIFHYECAIAYEDIKKEKLK